MLKSKFAIIGILSLVLCVTAQAGNDKDGNTTVNNNNNPVAHGGQGGTGGAGGQGGNANAGAIAGASSVAEAKANAAAIAAQQQGQVQGQQQSNSNKNNVDASSKNANTNKVSNAVGVSVGGDTLNIAAQARDPVSTAYSHLAAPSAPCMGSSSVGAQGVGFGLSVGSTWTSEDCNKREDIRAAFSFGDKEVAEEMLMENVKGYAAAKQRVADRKAAAVAGK